MNPNPFQHSAHPESIFLLENAVGLVDMNPSTAMEGASGLGTYIARMDPVLRGAVLIDMILAAAALYRAYMELASREQ